MARDTSTVRYPIFARGYARMAVKAEAKGAAEHRDELLAGLAGRTRRLHPIDPTRPRRRDAHVSVHMVATP